MFNSLKIPLLFLITGVAWARFSDPLITFFTQNLKPADQDWYRSLNDFAGVIITAFVLYLLMSRQQKNLARSEEEYRELFESNPNPMWIYDSHTLHIVKANDAAVDKYGYSMDAFLQMSVLDFQLKEDRDRLEKYLKANQHVIRRATTRQHIKSDGEILNVSIVAYPVFFNNQQCSLAMSTDMTELFDKERKLQEAYQRIKAANEALMQLAWANSHEIRKPLCSILSLINLMKYANDEQEKQEFLNLLEISSIELDQILLENNEKVDKMAMIESV